MKTAIHVEYGRVSHIIRYKSEFYKLIVNLVIRHGTRNPKRKVIDSINVHLANIRNEMMEKGNPKLCPGDIERLRKWESQVNVEEEKHLTYEGQDELLQMAERIQNRFPSLLPEQFSENLYKVS